MVVEARLDKKRIFGTMPNRKAADSKQVTLGSQWYFPFNKFGAFPHSNKKVVE